MPLWWSSNRTVFQTINIHHFQKFQQTATNISNLNSCLVSIFNRLTERFTGCESKAWNREDWSHAFTIGCESKAWNREDWIHAFTTGCESKAWNKEDWSHAFTTGCGRKLKKMVPILCKFTVLCLSSDFFVYFFQNKTSPVS